MSVKLNMGCGNRKLAGYVNVDKFAECNPDVQFDAETTPWPWATSSIDEVSFIHSLEHMGQSSEVFLAIMRELYRVLVPGGLARIHVPHPRHDNFIGDPTHVRAITATQMSLFDRRLNDEWKAGGTSAATPLAHYLNIDFETVDVQQFIETRYLQMLQSGAMTLEQLNEIALERNNVISETHLTLSARKPAFGT